jgi:hypothetical protein
MEGKHMGKKAREQLTIAIHAETKARLDQWKVGDESYNSAINRALDIIMKAKEGGKTL